MTHLAASYPYKPIASIKSLSKALNITEQRLKLAAQKANFSYRLAKEEVKPDSSIRQTFDAFPELKSIQERIKRCLLNQVRFPIYIQGSVRDREQPRHCIQNAGLHVNSRTVVTEDATNFFPSISADTIYQIWLRFFSFVPDVATLLTSLTTRHGILAQGAKTSSGLANLAFWDLESDLVQRFESRGLRYSRYVDDITVSSTRRLSDDELQRIISDLIAMFARRGCRINRAKHRIAHTGRRLAVNNLPVHGDRPAASRQYRHKIRAATHKIERSVATGTISQQQFEKDRTSVLARIDRIAKLGHVSQADKLRAKIEQTSAKAKSLF